jgi:hypothetical protein
MSGVYVMIEEIYPIVTNTECIKVSIPMKHLTGKFFEDYGVIVV